MLARILACSLLAALLLSAARSRAVEVNDLGARRSPEAEAAPGRLLVRFQPSSVAAAAKPTADPVAALARRSGIALSGLKDLGAGIHLLAVPPSPGALQSLAERLRRDPEVAEVALDRRRFAHRLPNDPLFNGQWYLQSAQVAAIRAEQAWDTTTGSSGIVVADLDTGVRFEHPDLGRAAQGGKLLPGYDFVSADSGGGFLVANDGSGWDPDPTDPGDWISAQDAAKPQFKGCTVADSSWHGTRTAGMIAAAGNNGAGIAGGSWITWLLPVRVLGKCGGFDSDIIAAMRWAAGLHVNGVPDNPYPARILNMSLGNTDTTQCQIYQPVVDELVSHGVLVVVSAGNEGGAVDEPANCRGVLAVAGLRHAGTKVGYSNLGPQIGISAPAGNCVNANGGPCLYSLDTTTDRGLTSAAGATYTDQINSNLGTSFSAPQVSAVAALMLAVDGRLDAALLVARLQRGARTFPTPSVGDAGQLLPSCHVPAGPTDVQSTECVCNIRVCGAGMLNAAGGVQEALKPIASIQATGSVSAGATVTLDASASSAACGRRIASYLWTAVDESGQPVALTSATQPTTALVAPASGTVTVSLTLVDDQGATETASVHVTPVSADRVGPVGVTTASCPAAVKVATTGASSGGTSAASGGSGKGGGGALDPLGLLMLVGAATMRFRRGARLQ